MSTDLAAGVASAAPSVTSADPAEPVASEAASSRAEKQSLLWAGLLLSLAATSITIGIMWDISWHITIGRDTFWTPAHMAIYFGGALGGTAAGWLAFKYTFLATPFEKATSVCILGARAP